MNPLKQMGRGHIGHIERRILAQPDHIEFGQVPLGPLAEIHMVPGLGAQGDVAATGNDAAFVIAQLIHRILKQPVTTRLRLESDAKAAIAINCHMFDRVHLQCDVKAHSKLPDWIARLSRGRAWDASGKRLAFAKGVFHDLDPANPVDQRHIEAHLG